MQAAIRPSPSSSRSAPAHCADLVALYQYHGPDALKSSVTNNTYPPELKRQAVEEYQSGQGTQRDICLKYNIRARTQLRNWIRQYGSGDLSSAASQRANPRKKKTIPGVRPPSTNASTSSAIVLPTTEITSFPPYPQRQLSAGVFLGQKYDAYGLDGLLDGRGRHRDPARMDPLERAEYENKILQDKITRLETEVLALKKLRDLERRWD